MSVKARAEVTLVLAIDVKAVYRYYLLQSSTLSKPAKPTQWPPGGCWVDTEPGYTSGSTNSLYCVDCTVLSDETFIYSEVSLSSSYEAAKEAYNKAQAAQEAVGKKNTVYYQAEQPDGNAYVVNDLWFDTSKGNAIYCWDGSQWVAKQFGTDALAVGSVTAERISVADLQALEATIGGITIGKNALFMVNRVVAEPDPPTGTGGVVGGEDDEPILDDGNIHITVEEDEGEIYQSPAEDGTYNILSSNCTEENSAFLVVAAPTAERVSEAKAYLLHDGRAKFQSIITNGAVYIAGSDLVVERKAEESVQCKVRNSLRAGSLDMSKSGNFGLWDTTNQEWMLYSNTGKNVLIPHPTYVEGTRVPTVISGTTATITVAANGSKDITVSFGHTFAAAPVVQITPIWNTSSLNAHLLQVTVASRTTTGCTIRILNGHTASFSPAVMWTAIGT